VRGGKPRIPPGAPGHPMTEAKGGRGAGPGSIRPKRDPASPIGPRSPALVPATRAKAVLVYEDDELLAYDKPSGLPVIPADGSRSRSLLDIATEQVRRHNPKGRAAVVHRIDRDTSGIVIFAKSAAMKKELMGDWDELVSERLYIALVTGSMGGDSGAYDSWLKEDDKGRIARARAGERGAKRAVTNWRLLAEGSGLSLVELSLETGRRHQIRVQLADAGHPIVGDERYGASRGAGHSEGGRLCLHATAIELALPGKQPLRIESPAPREFERALRAAPKLSAPRASASSSPSAARRAGRPRPPSAPAKGRRGRP
jgi:23S rRNA pseudouridine1911/1915/1917 synthase